METRRDTGSSGPQQIVILENAEDEENLEKIPGNLSERERQMLQMTQAEEERGAVRVIKCKLCPKALLSSWVTFQLHCRSCEKHPSEIRFCATCGDHFARPDSGKRHMKKEHQEACHNTSHDEAEKKREKVERIFYAFNTELTKWAGDRTLLLRRRDQGAREHFEKGIQDGDLVERRLSTGLL